MKYLLLMALILVGCSGQEIPKELQAEIDKTKKVEVKPVEAAPAEPEKKADEVDPSRLKTLEDKVNFIMDLVVKDVECSKKRKAAEPALNSCQEKCEQDFPEPEEQEDPPPALIDGQCVQVKLAHPPENKQNRECNDGCWNQFRDSARCQD